jgi:hypothetical protein
MMDNAKEVNNSTNYLHSIFGDEGTVVDWFANMSQKLQTLS